MDTEGNSMATSASTISSYVCMEIGTVIRAHVNSTNPPKTKRFIIVGHYEGKVITVFFNSEINELINFSHELQSLHIPFASDGRPYLVKDCYCDCSKIMLEDGLGLHTVAKTNPEIIIGKLEKEDLDNVMNMLKSSPKIKGTYKKRYGFYEYGS